MSEVMSGLFDDDTSVVQLEQVVFDYRLLSADKREFVLQKTDETQWLLKKTAENIVKIGKNLQEVKAVLLHGQFLPWIRSEFGMSRQSADNFVHVAEKFGDKMLNFSNLATSALYLLAAPGTPQEAVDEALQRAETGEKITHALAKQIIEEQEARKKAEQTATQSLANLAIVQHLLVKTEEEATAKIAELEQRITQLSTPQIQYEDKEVWPDEKVKEMADLQQRLTTLSADLEVEKKSIPADAQRKMDALQKQLEKLKEEQTRLTKDRDQQEEHIKKLNADIDMAIRKREFAENADRIRQQWRGIMSEVHACHMRLLGQWPTPVDTQTFDADDWSYVEHLESTLRRILEECRHLRYSGTVVDHHPSLMVVESGVM